MKKVMATMVISAAAMALPQAVQAEGLVRIRAGVAPTDYTLSFSDTSQKIKSDYTAKNVGLTFVSEGGFYLDMIGQTSGDATHDAYAPTYPDQKFTRTDFTLTLGLSIPGQSGTGSVFGGFKAGSSEFSAPPGFSWTKDTFSTAGIFFGAGYAFPAIGGQIGINGAIAFMSGTWEDDGVPKIKEDADYTFGYSFGLGYTYMFGKNFGLAVDYKWQHYSYGFDQGTLSPYTADENINSLGLTALVQF